MDQGGSPRSADWSGRIECAWCGGVIREAQGDGPVSHGICEGCVGGSGFLPVEFVHGLDSEAADALPMGYLRLDSHGRVVEYNTQEARLSGLGRDRVLGRDFFQEVAPCTRVRDFEGRFRALLEAGVAERVEFRFVFRFQDGDRPVHVAMTHQPGEGTVVLVRAL